MNNNRIRNALIDQLLVQFKQSGLASVFMVTVVGLGIWWSFPKEQVIAWVLLGYVVTFPRYVVLNWIKKWAAKSDPYPWLEGFMLFSLFLSGLHWGRLVGFFSILIRRKVLHLSCQQSSA